ncbi:MAG: NAD-dependent epimerase/dehydratase family protein [Oligoflexia bacterium]|nr:NAD-dependent epimerase/dehydratase family protein [Oligoflexia bacterium]
MKKILILGISGFIGRNLLEFIFSHNLHSQYHFIGVDKNPNIYPLDPLPLHATTSSFEFITLNLLDFPSLVDLVANLRPDYIINLAGTFVSEDWETLVKVNATLPKVIIEACLQHHQQIEKILLIGSAAEYGIPYACPIKEDSELRPINLYGLSKVFQTNIFNYLKTKHQVPVVMARTFNIIGPNQSNFLSVGNFISQLKKISPNISPNGEIFVGNLDSKRDFLDIRDVIQMYFNILFKGGVGEIYNVCSKQSINIQAILKNLIKISQKKVTIINQNNYFTNNTTKSSTTADIIQGDNSKITEHNLGIMQLTPLMDSLEYAYSRTLI